MAASKHVVIIGAGMGGLACAIDLARQGFDVTVAEAASAAGGKLRTVDAAGRGVDSGPTVLTLRGVFDALFQSAGADLDRRLVLRPSRVLARHAWADGSRLDLFADLDESADAIGRFAGAAEAAGFRAFSAESRRIFQTLDHPFLRRQRTGVMGLTARVGLGHLRDLVGLRPFETLWTSLRAHFRDPRLRQLFGRYATYCGSSPFAAPATLMLIAHAERQGVWLVDGGMQRLAQALESLARELGVVFRFRSPVDRIEVTGRRATGIFLEGGERLGADAVVMNGDPQALASGLLGGGARRAVRPYSRERRSFSAVTWSMAGDARGFPLSRHNVFFSDDYSAEFDEMRASGKPALSPTIYVCAQDREDGRAEAAGAERFLVLVNAPALGDSGCLDSEELKACEIRVWDHLKRCGLDLDPPTTGQATTPGQFARMFPATGGALYGAATHGWAAAFRRPGARTRIAHLYLAGGGVHPGAGLPMAALSGRLAAEQLVADLPSTAPFRRAAMPGGTSTP